MHYSLAIAIISTFISFAHLNAQHLDEHFVSTLPATTATTIVAPTHSTEEGRLPIQVNLTDSWVSSLKPMNDSLTLGNTIDRLKIKSVWAPKSSHALLWSILPGGGQIYNRRYWKVPIVWGAMMSCFYAINWNQRLYSEYHTAYRDLKSENPAENTAWLAFAPNGTKPEDYARMNSLTNTLKRGNDFYRRYRDLSIVVSILVYGLSMLDAYVDAELYSFDISPDLSMQLSPTLIPSGGLNLPTEGQQYQVGLACLLTF